MRKGHSLESHLDKLVKYINSAGYHAHKNHPKRLLDGTYIEGECFDYEVFTPSGYMVFDAKECHENTWKLLEKDIKQAEHLKHCKCVGLEAFFLIYFYKLKKLISIDVDIVINALKTGKKSIGASEGTEFDIKKIINTEI